ncbi:MAG TPA: carbon-nitrogen hydrolase family protein [Gammaproteobacteria bacterium]|nr:carbon-nitrogen hydrolase family protein [Gammaproteobacteria bacterium]
MTKVAAIQMCSSHLVDENLKLSEKLINEAAQNNAKLIVFPEMFAIMGQKPTDKIIAKETFGHGHIQSFLSEQAKKNGVWIVGGTIPIECGDKNKIRAACLVFDNNGKCVARYDKIHLFDVVLSETETYKESDTTEPGNELVVVDTPFGKLGLAVCYDLRFPELFRHLFNKGAEIIAIPSAFTVPTGEAHWELLARSRAIENFSYLIGACQGGTHSSGRKTYGNSIIVEPWGAVSAKKEGTEPGIIYTTIDLKKAYEARKSVPIADHQRIFFDTSNFNEAKVGSSTFKKSMP